MVTLSTFGRQVEQTPEMASARLSDIRQRVTDLEKVVIENERKGTERRGGFMGFGRSTFSRTAPPRNQDAPNLVKTGTTVVQTGIVTAAAPFLLAGVAKQVTDVVINNPELIGALGDTILEKTGLDAIPGFKIAFDGLVNTVQILKSAQEAFRMTTEQTFAGVKAQVTLGGADADFSDTGVFIANIFRINQARNLLDKKQRQAAQKILIENSVEIAKGLIP